MQINIRNITWQQLADAINSKIPEGQRGKPVLIWGEEQPLANDCVLCCENEDYIANNEYFEDNECDLRSNFSKEEQEGMTTILAAGTFYLFR